MTSDTHSEHTLAVGRATARPIQSRLSRRQALRLGGLALGGLTIGALAACAPSSGPSAATAPTTAAPAKTGAPAAAGGTFDWQRYKGQTITALQVQNSRTEIMVKYQPEFEELTGIKVNADVLPEQQQRQKLLIEFSSGNPSFDVTTLSWHVLKGVAGKGKWFVDLRDWVKDPAMTAPDYDYSDFTPAAVTYATQKDGTVDTLPLQIDFWILYWNKELFQKIGLQFPNTLDEVLAAAQALNDPTNRIYGFVGRGLKNANVPVWTAFMQGWDVDPIDKTNQMHTNGEEAVAAATAYQQLLSKYGPPGVSGFNWNESQTTFSQGGAAMWFDGIGFASPLEDPTKSKVKGKVGYGLQPGGPKGRFTATFGDGIGVVRASKKQGPAYLYALWSTNKKNQARMLAAGAASPARTSAYSDPDAMANMQVPQEWVDTLIAAGKIGRPGLPEIEPVTEFRDTFGIALTNMIGGADPKAELDKATADFKPVLDKSLQA
ncbi:MAG: extracellular solute-binding protein [Chloroflexi bacterium]|nr:extracellular solute-binding protein [Chloroflexota bacterium]